MTLKGTNKLLHILRSHGVSHFKSAEIEIRFGVSPTQEPLIAVGPVLPRHESTSPVPATAAAAPPVDLKIPHHINEVAALLKLSDEELVDKMFPPEPEQEAAE